MTGRTTQQWLDILQAADIAAQPCHSLESLTQDAHLQAVGLIDFEDHPTEGRTAALRASIRVNEDTLPRRAPAQPRGADTREMLAELGYSVAQVESMLVCGAARATSA